MAGSVRVLLVGFDDHERSAFSDFLAGKRMQVVEARDCAEALFRMRCQRIDALVAPGQAGANILTALQGERTIADIPVIGLLDSPDESADPRFCTTRPASSPAADLFFALLSVLDCHAGRVSLPRRDANGVCPGAAPR
ncbi:MAG: hypothetical protein ACE148_13230 [Vicinamibacterales bacterium]